MPTQMTPVSPADLTVKEGWRRFVDAPQCKAPSKPSSAARKAMTASAREAFDQARREHHSRFGPVATLQMKRVHDALRLQADSNLYLPSGARPGSVIDGEADSGKTTILTQFGRRHERALRKRYPGELTDAGGEFLPVAYVTLAAATTVKSVSRQFLDFYGYPISPRATQVELTMHMQKAALRCLTKLMLIDDVHFLNLNNQPDRVVNDHLKYLASVIPATFVYAGIDCEEGGLLREGKSRVRGKAFSQTGSRFTLHRIDKFSIDTGEGAQRWVELLAGIERELVLMNSVDGMLSKKLWRYLFDRTHGEIGSLTSLLRQGAFLAIENGSERLTNSLLDEIELSYDAEAESQRRGTRKRITVSGTRARTAAQKTVAVAA